MGKEKYIYNKYTLRYEKINTSFRKKIIRGLGVAGAITAYTLLVYTLSPSKNTGVLAEELAQMKYKYQEMNQQIDQMSSALGNLHERDQAIYRQVLDMDLTDENVWIGGRGGSDKYADIRNLSDGELLIATGEKLNQLRHQLAISAKSQDKVLNVAESKEEMLAAVPSIRPIRLPKKKLTALSGFGYRVHPVFKTRKMHTGIDFGARRGTPIYATGSGKVVRVEYKKNGYGKNVVIDHGYGYQTLYGHMSKFKCKVGQKVKRGEVIGLVGSTGTSTSPHIHYEVIYKGAKINPLQFCLDGLSPKEYKVFVDKATAENQAMSINSK